MSKLFITGAAGMIGSNVCQFFLDSGYEVVGIDNFWRGTEENIAPLRSSSNFTFRELDLSESLLWAEDMQPDDAVIHIADIVAGIGYVFSNEYDVFAMNCKINSMVTSVIRDKTPTKVIYLGTACSYPQDLQRDVDNSMLSEKLKFPADPESGYGWSKLIGEIELKLAVKDQKTDLVILDLHNVYGTPCIYKEQTSQVIPSLIWRAYSEKADSLTVWGNGQQGRAFVHVKDVVSAVFKAFEYGGDQTNFMIGPDFCTTIRTVAETILKHPKINVQSIDYDLDKPMGDIGRFADYSLASSELGWNPTMDLQEGIFELIDYVVDQEKLS